MFETWKAQIKFLEMKTTILEKKKQGWGKQENKQQDDRFKPNLVDNYIQY